MGSHEALQGQGNPQQWQAHKQQLTQLDGWEINGKIASARPRTPVRHAVLAAAPGLLRHPPVWPIGPRGSASDRTPGRCQLEVANQGRYQATTPEELLEQQLGWKLPVSHLSWWVRGLPAPRQQEPLTLDGNSRLAGLAQDGWTVEYLSYAEQNGYWLPERIKLHGQDLDVTLVVKDWQPRRLGQ